MTNNGPKYIWLCQLSLSVSEQAKIFFSGKRFLRKVAAWDSVDDKTFEILQIALCSAEEAGLTEKVLET